MFYDYFESHTIGTLTLAADNEGLRFVYFPKSVNPKPIQPDWRYHPPFFQEVKPFDKRIQCGMDCHCVSSWVCKSLCRVCTAGF